MDYRIVLQQTFGFAELRPGQGEAVRQLLDGKSVLAIFPTGGGKSLCYQLPALLLDGLTLVVSPLIALMKDQVDFLHSKGVAAARLDSTLELDAARQVLAQVTAGQLRILYVAPERLVNERFQQTLRRVKLALLAVDEAHCISEWGHNFRPDYLKLAGLARELKVPRILALTATATPAVADDIARAFGIGRDSVLNTGYYRPNLFLHVTPCRRAEKVPRLLERLRSRPRGATIVYVTLQKTAEEVSRALAEQGQPARHYHAGLETAERESVQDWFMSGGEPIVVATIAFGMGIDKADIRAVYHYDLPKSLENYVQEIGRAGRDGLPSDCELFACAADRRVLENFVLGDTPGPEAVAGVIGELSQFLGRVDLSLYDLAGKYDIRPLVLDTLLTYLELEGVLRGAGASYQEYRFQPRRTSAEILARFDEKRAAFLRRLLSKARKGKTWFSVSVDEVAAALQEPRERITAALHYLADEGDLVLQPTKVRHGFFSKDLTAAQRGELTRKMVGQFLQREKRDLARLQHVFDYAQQGRCLTAFVLRYFGDRGVERCGHCSRCAGQPAVSLPGEPPHPFGPADVALAAGLRGEGHDSLRKPRQLARFLCGLSSPAASRARLQRDPRFGGLSDRSFVDVLAWLEHAI